MQAAGMVAAQAGRKKVVSSRRKRRGAWAGRQRGY